MKGGKVSRILDLEGKFWSALSPDGRFLVATTQDGQQLMLCNFLSQKWSEMLKGNIGFTQWSGDNKYVYFDTGSSADPAVFRVRVADRKLERVAGLKNFRRVVTPWISWNGITPDGAPLLMQ